MDSMQCSHMTQLSRPWAWLVSALVSLLSNQQDVECDAADGSIGVKPEALEDDMFAPL